MAACSEYLVDVASYRMYILDNSENKAFGEYQFNFIVFNAPINVIPHLELPPPGLTKVGI